MSGAVMDTCKAHNMPSCGQCAQKLAFEAAVKEGDDDKAAELLKAGADISRTAGPTLRVALQKKMDKLAAGVLLSPHLKNDALTKQNLTFEKLATDGFNKAAGAFVQRQAQDAEEAGQVEPGTDADGNTHLHILARENGSPELVRGIVEGGVSVNKENKTQDTPLHLAAKGGHVEMCKLLFELGANVFHRNSKNRTPRSQIKISQEVKNYLGEAEEIATERKKKRDSELWDDKMKATQTESALGCGVL
mmetsp:Transcript_39473/g.70756  ORF Transcript_39473/g.70756 Transcript_39473/m.70756 type:complete len:248 (-) Transcript_39473:151-894(-)|eukprot:CAMPEP_0177791174 /NCGR_PEP_ID=MMETSP0491_2-20121128/23784_1 /TAXON_ID=63592 /ORGANISM="Tetraselmis chuii, Strain PLY429" /LENGTH=247 /DNA_ID=CAMNT_0019313371 /DNA_START=121 /DNA_END=864 /DNA_ORIENTATION=-